MCYGNLESKTLAFHAVHREVGLSAPLCILSAAWGLGVICAVLEEVEHSVSNSEALPLCCSALVILSKAGSTLDSKAKRLSQERGPSRKLLLNTGFILELTPCFSPRRPL